ncbi:MAG TPA: hypothetical protein VGC01_11805 [Mucilaginibacter sp.]
MEEKDIQNELSSIRSLMERSSKFISLSGLTGILAGVYALAGSAAAYFMLYGSSTGSEVNISLLVGIAVVVMLAALITALILTKSKAKKSGQPIWDRTSRTLLFQLATPLVIGGFFILILLSRGYYDIVAPVSLIFYGLALISASSFTYSDVRYLGIAEILAGLIAACLPTYGLLFWAIGFGVLHVIYGSVVYLKYGK